MKIAFLFPGQGSQYVGMGKELYDNFEIVRDFYNNLSSNFVKDLTFNGPEEKLRQTTYTQPCLVALELAIAFLLESKFGIRAEGVLGLSLGEYSSLVYANIINSDEAVNLVHKRGIIMDTSLSDVNGSMSAILNIDDTVLENICRKISDETNQIVEVANYNCPGQRVITGHAEAVSKASEVCIANGARKAIPLNVSGPFHSSLYKEASKKLRKELDKLELDTQLCDVYFNSTGGKSNENLRDIMQRQIYSPVLFENCIEEMIKDGFDTFIEVGPSTTLSGFVKKIERKVKTYNVEDIKSLNKVLEVFKKERIGD